MGDEGDEASLVQRASKGEPDAFAALFDRYYPMIHAFAYLLCLDRTDAEDVAQETFIKAARAIATVRGSFKGWLYRIAHNTATDLLRGRMRRGRLGDELGAREARAQQGRAPDYSPVNEALGALPDDLRAAIVLTFYEGMNHAEAGRVLGCAETTVSWRVFMAKRRLRKLLSGPSQ